MVLHKVHTHIKIYLEKLNTVLVFEIIPITLSSLIILLRLLKILNI